MTCFSCGGQYLLGFCTRAKNDLFLLWVSIDLVFGEVVDID